jgi:hypothetical protein
MLTVLSSYAGEFNRRHGRVGHLFQGRYKASLIRDDRHLLAVVRYVHRNPVAARIVERADLYSWSSDRIYRRGGAPVWIDTATVLGILDSKPELGVGSYVSLVDGVAPSELVEPLASVAGEGVVLDLPPSTVPVLRGRAVELFLRFVAESTSVSVERMLSSARDRSTSRARAIAAFLARDLARIPISRTAEALKRDESTISRRVVRLERELAEDCALQELLGRLRTDLINNAILHG